MTSSRKPVTSKHLLSSKWNDRLRSPEFWLIAVSLVWLAHGASLGLTDDEAYYWVLSQKPALGYAFHPPAVAWCIALARVAFGWLLGSANSGLVRLPAVLCAAGMVGLGLKWMRLAGVSEAARLRGLAIMLSFAGFSALAWMIVPDFPLLLGWTWAFVSTWEVCFAQKASSRSYVALVGAIALALLSKYSAVLAAVSALAAIGLWAPKARKLKGSFAVLLGGLLAAVPVLIWNSQHEWASILYQIRDRHGTPEFSWIRYGRFWLIEILVAGPGIAFYAFFALTRWKERTVRYVYAWIVPGAAVFLTQPLWSDFKPHWAFVVWWPVALLLGWAWGSSLGKRSSLESRLAPFQCAYGALLAMLVLIACHYPIQGWVTRHWFHRDPDPRWDVTNDLYGWSELKSYLNSHFRGLRLPVIGSRYQTASQAGFALGPIGSADGWSWTMIPRDLKSRDEWPDLKITDGVGPEWPKLRTPVFFVADNRYDMGPGFPNARCAKVGRTMRFRSGFIAKKIDVWLCEPEDQPPSAKSETRRRYR